MLPVRARFACEAIAPRGCACAMEISETARARNAEKRVDARARSAHEGEKAIKLRAMSLQRARGARGGMQTRELVNAGVRSPVTLFPDPFPLLARASQDSLAATAE
jgi:hypothetical protein